MRKRFHQISFWWIIFGTYCFQALRAPFQYENRLSKYRIPIVTIIVSVMRPSYLYNGNPYTCETTSAYWNGPGRRKNVFVRLATTNGVRFTTPKSRPHQKHECHSTHNAKSISSSRFIQSYPVITRSEIIHYSVNHCVITIAKAIDQAQNLQTTPKPARHPNLLVTV